MSMQFQDIKAVFLAVLEKTSPQERAAYLDEACGPDTELRRRVEALLKASEESGAFLDQPPLQPADLPGTIAYKPISEQPGTVIGPYKLLQQIGEGGMGTVFMAEQTHPVQRKVALKVIKPGMDSRQVIARFEAERQALAMMDHVNIARVLDAGATESGRPYFVMELVHGVPITKYCDDNHLTPRERLELFVPVCQAIQHAHQKGIIHRDIKPSNVMITLYDGKPVPKVIDFGVAKATEQRLTERTLFTQYGTMVGTLEYMSPEQAEMSALGVDTRSDIYSLGVLLYELLTGSTPLSHKRVKEAAYAEVLRMIKEEEPPKPSTRLSDSGEALASISANRHTEPAKLAKLVRGELDWIVMKTLEKDRNRRYETANAFAADVQRYLSDEAVLACPPSAGYRFRKFARRNKAVLATATAVAVAVMLAVGSLVSAVKVLAASNAQINEEQKQTKDALGREKQANDKLLTALNREQQTLYVQRIGLAERELAANNVGRAEELLDECPLHLRGWEWHYLKRLRHASPLVLRGEAGSFFGSVAFSPDGRHLAVAITKPANALLVGEVKVWDAVTGRESRTLRGHTGPVGSLAFSPDGKRLASGGQSFLRSGEVKIWDATTGKELFPLRGHPDPVYGVAFSPDGRFLATATGNSAKKTGEVKIWDATTGHEIRTLRGHTNLVSRVAFHPDGRHLASASWDETVRVWDPMTGKETLTLRGHLDLVSGLAFSPDGRWLASASQDMTVKVWDATAGQEIRTLHGHIGPVGAVAFSCDGQRVISTGWDKTVKVWETATGQEMLTLRGHTDIVTGAVFSPDGQRLASASKVDATVRIWDGTPLEDRTRQGACILRGHTGIACHVAFSGDGQRLASASFDGTVKVWEARTGHEILTLRGHESRVTSLAFSPDGRHLASAGLDKTVKLWDVSTGQEVRTLRGHGGAVTSVAFHPDGKQLASGSADGTVKVWDTRTGQEVLTRESIGRVSSVAFSPDGQRLASASSLGQMKIWNATTGQEVLSFTGNRFYVFCIAFSPDGRHLASAGWDGAVKVWDVTTGREALSLNGHSEWALGVAFSPDGQRLASAGADSTVKVWEVETSQAVLTLRGHIGPVFSVAFSPDGQRLAAASGYSGKGEVKIWDLTQEGERPKDQ